MEENTPYNRSREEGRNVWAALSAQAGEGAGFLGAMAGSLLRFLHRNLAGMLIAGIILGGAGAGYMLLQRHTVHASMTLSYSQLEKKIYADMLDKLEQLRSAGQYAAMASVLGIPESQARAIAKIDSRNINNEPLTGDLSTQKVPFYVTVDVYDASLLPALQEALVTYVNEPVYVKGRLKLNEQNYLGEIAMLEKQMADLDTLRSRLAATRDPDAGTVTAMNTLNKSRGEMFARLRDLRGALQYNKNIEVLDGFVGCETPVTGRIVKFFLAGFAAGALIFLLIRGFRK